MTAAAALELHAIEKRFGSVVALAGASLSAGAGSLHMLLGENGAGKTTLLRAAAGFIRPDSGEIFVNGSRVQWRSRAEALRAGIAIVEQHFSLVPAMTVAENVALAATPASARFHVKTAAEVVDRIAKSVGLTVDPLATVSTLSVAAQQRAEIVKALSINASLLILDEPTAVLTPSQSDDLFVWLRSFVGTGCTAIVITHRIREAMRHGDSLTVLRGGATVLSAVRDSVSRDEVVGAILGSQERSSFPIADIAPRTHESSASTTAIVSLRGVSVRDGAGVTRLRDASLDIRPAEIIGVAGVEGSGQRELLRVLGGRMRPTEGTVSLPPTCGFIPEDRLRDALIPQLSLQENVAMRGIGHRAGLLDWNQVAAAAKSAIASFDVRAEGLGQSAGTLSGGNQQKLVLARELADSPSLIVAANPTRGLDVRASADVMRKLAEARNAGAAVVIYSSDLEDLVGFADRVLVCFDGTVREVACDFEAIGNAMLGSA